ncbi:HNH endonuclease [Lentzea sp. BCCO 10_0798]|uniref:HNH endonuclease n=1 Tax=Lentzea kristufekii TaxID=3095430 RepID=A0ABU4TQU6_9PSEU|nr:AAA family ATPase [Lentzea sp. BCCO 10_0798]MDX8050414.1 HNH endonuclease [Lentzea sp. BCCO 10_0798]
MPPAIILIAGPPCSGKSTYALKHARGGDVVLDRDVIAQQLGSGLAHMHLARIARQAEQHLQARLDELRRSTRDGTVYVVRSLPGAHARHDWVARYNARLVLLDPGLDECLRRAHRDGRPRGTVSAIRQWYERNTAGSRHCMDCGGPATSVRCGSCCDRLRSGRPWRRVQEQVWREETHCWICSAWVDQHLPAGHAWSRTVDHRHALRDGGPPLDRDNCRLAHRRCNTSRTNQARAQGAAKPKRMVIAVDPRTI